jgi:hypothetical protein
MLSNLLIKLFLLTPLICSHVEIFGTSTPPYFQAPYTNNLQKPGTRKDTDLNIYVSKPSNNKSDNILENLSKKELAKRKRLLKEAIFANKIELCFATFERKLDTQATDNKDEAIAHFMFALTTNLQKCKLNLDDVD